MIVDHLKNAESYYGVSEGIRKGLEFLASQDFRQMEPGRHDLPDNLYCILVKYNTKPVEECRFEIHRKYIDIQFVLEGAERIAYADISLMKPTTEYDEHSDLQFLEGKGDWVTLDKGTFAIFMPQDAHMPSVHADNSSQPVLKVVVKVPVGF